jgi:flagellar protein FlaE/flagellar protein FlaC
MGILDSVTGGQEQEDSPDEDEDLFGEQDEGLGEEGFGEQEDDEWDDEFGGGDDSVIELEERVDELEAEVNDMSSTVSTIKKENEEVSEQLDEIEENVRTLLEIYEMVTRGVNPFADEDSAMAGEGFDLFDTGDQADETSPQGSQVMEAEAEEFFEGDDFEESDFEGDETDQEEEMIEETETGDATFDDLKEQYEDEGEWEENEDEKQEKETDETFEELKEQYEEETELEEVQKDEPSETEPGPEAVPEEDTGEEKQKDEIEKIYDDERIKLESLPRGYASDALIMEWVDFLIRESGVEDAVRSVNYYAEIEWVTDNARDELKSFMLGHPDVEEEDTKIESASPASVQMDDHLESLRYVSRLEGGTDGREVVEHMD